MDKSIPTFEKPHTKLTVLDWTRNIQKLQEEARSRRYESFELRQRANQLRNEASITTHWDTYVNNELLRSRINEVKAWREEQRYCRESVRDETRALREEKHATELLLEHLQIPFNVVSQCLGNRDQRVPPELTRDQLGEELKNELFIIENSKRVLTEICHMAWVHIKDLDNVFCRLEREIKNKDETVTLETAVRSLNWESAGLSRKVDPTRVPGESMSENSYVSCIQNTLEIAKKLMTESKELRARLFHAREQATNQLYAQCNRVEIILRRRVYDIQRARNEMEWQKLKLEQNLSKLDLEIHSLRAAIAQKINPTKLVETRLEMRTRRPVLELVQDEQLNGLIEEHQRLGLSTSMLEQKLEEALKTYHGLYNHLQRVTKDLQNKNQALQTDRRLIDIRKPLHVEGETQFDRNVGYCNIDREIVTD